MGLLCLGFILTTSVSFASDGPKTTKDCVIDNLDVMETSATIDQPIILTSDFNEFDALFQEARKSFDIEFKEDLINLQNTREVEKIDYGVSNLTSCNTKKQKTNRTNYRFIDKSNPIRKLTKE